jgi:hypothetical protein
MVPTFQGERMVHDALLYTLMLASSFVIAGLALTVLLT